MAAATAGLQCRPGAAWNPSVAEAKACADFAKVLSLTLSANSAVHPARGNVRPVIGFDDRDGSGKVKPQGGQVKDRTSHGVHPNAVHRPRPRSNSRASTDSVKTDSSESGDSVVDGVPVRKSHQDEGDGAQEVKKERKGAWKRIKDRIVRPFRRRRKTEEKTEEKEEDESPGRRRGSSFLRSLRHSFRRRSKKHGDTEDENSPPKETETSHPPQVDDRRDEPFFSAHDKPAHDEGDSVGSCSPAGTSRRFSLDLPYADEVSWDWEGDSAMGFPRLPPGSPPASDVEVDGGGAPPPVYRYCSLEEDGGEDETDGKELHDEELREVANYLNTATEPDFQGIGQEIRRIGDAGDTWLRDAPEGRATPTLDWQHLRAPPAGEDPPAQNIDATLTELEQELVQVLREKADSTVDRVCSWFARTVERYLGDEHTWSQVRFFSLFTVVVCRTVRDSGYAVPRLTSLAEDFFQRRLAPWVAQHGGVGNMPRPPRDTGEVD